jgi:hypothetical protein
MQPASSMRTDGYAVGNGSGLQVIQAGSGLQVQIACSQSAINSPRRSCTRKMRRLRVSSRWWGSDAGPGNVVEAYGGIVDYTPFLLADPEK